MGLKLVNEFSLSQEEKDEIFSFLWDNIFDHLNQANEWYLDPSMAKLIEYLGIRVPQDITVKYSNGKTYIIKLLKAESEEAK